MAILYKPVLIESAEQASTLPRDVLIYDADQGQVYVDAPPGHAYEGEFVDIDGDVTFADDLIGCTALVPIEAEEEYGAEMKWDDRTPHDTHVSLGLSLDNARWQAENNPDYATGRIMRQYRTPWEEA